MEQSGSITFGECRNMCLGRFIKNKPNNHLSQEIKVFIIYKCEHKFWGKTLQDTEV
jgi:hypothetical protein